VNLQIGGARAPRPFDIFGLNVLAAPLYLAGDG
jgi:hypothetical protein